MPLLRTIPCVCEDLSPPSPDPTHRSRRQRITNLRLLSSAIKNRGSPTDRTTIGSDPEPLARVRTAPLGRLPQRFLIRLGRQRPVEVLVCQGGREAAARGAVEVTALEEERLVDVFDRLPFFADRGGERVDADRAAAEFVDDRG